MKNSCKQGYIIPDRIDIHCEIQAVPFAQLSQMQLGEPSAAIRERVLKARQTQESRFQGQKGIHCNAQMTEHMIHQYAEPDESSLELLRMAMERLKLSARAYNRILKVARTIADLEGSEGGGVTTLRKPSATAVWTVVTGLSVGDESQAK